MYSTYWLEIWVPETSAKRVHKILEQAPTTGHSLVRVWEHHSPEEAHTLGLNHLLDQFEEQISPLEAAGVKRQNMAVWLEGNYQQQFYLQLDPMTLMRLGQEDLKFCLTCTSETPAQWDQVKGFHQPKVVDVKDVWVEEEEERPGVALVTVNFDDGTFWTARFHTYQWLAINGPGLLRKQPYYWEPNMILVSNLEEETIQRTIVELLRQQRFEQAFSSMEPGGDTESPQHQTTIDLKILQPEAARLQLDLFQEIPRAQIIADPHFLILRSSQPSTHQDLTYLHLYLDLLDKHFPTLKAQGVQRKDLSLHLTYFYQDHCQLEFLPDLLDRMGRRGISLELSCQQVHHTVARSLE